MNARYRVMSSSLFLLLFLSACFAAPSAPTPILTQTASVAPPPTAFVPTPTTRPITVTQDITYTIPLQPNVDAETLDLYAPVGAQTAPAVVFAHGVGELKRDYRRISQAIAEAGAVVFTIEWPDRAFSASDNARGLRRIAETLSCAVRFARLTMAQRSAALAPLTLVGFSAGASAGAMMAFAGDNLERAWNDLAAARGAPPPQVKCVADGSARVDAFVGIAGPYNLAASLQTEDPQLWQVVSPYAHLNDNRSLRVRLLHGTNDNRVPIEQSLLFQEALSHAGYDSQLIRFDGPHAVPMPLTVEELTKLWQ